MLHRSSFYGEFRNTLWWIQFILFDYIWWCKSAVVFEKFVALVNAVFRTNHLEKALRKMSGGFQYFMQRLSRKTIKQKSIEKSWNKQWIFQFRCLSMHILLKQFHKQISASMECESISFVVVSVLASFLSTFRSIATTATAQSSVNQIRTESQTHAVLHIVYWR